MVVTLMTINPDGPTADTRAVKQRTERAHERSMCADLIKIVWTDGTGSKQKELAALEDISRGGACLQMDRPIPIDTAISILYPHGRYHGRIRYCIFEQTGYFLGVQFDPGYEWTKKDFMPSHLLELPTSLARKR